MAETCLFCQPDAEQVWIEDEIGLVLKVAFPVSDGHTLVLPRRHVFSIFELEEDEQAALWQLVSKARHELGKKFHPAGFNIGVNDGVAAGQTVMHAHIHIIPRYQNDAVDPKGGVRWVLPDKARYWSNP